MRNVLIRGHRHSLGHFVADSKSLGEHQWLVPKGRSLGLGNNRLPVIVDQDPRRATQQEEETDLIPIHKPGGSYILGKYNDYVLASWRCSSAPEALTR
ncbi:uncharacterized protein PADG_06037 [Paracoccidioides brasiliensis Pb18]|uniref:Uncharacterized protein n=1 Tax=Paracoccidioides brasiliensis (strain Pb18) TaxID=502780 RepID=C1GFK1_PARBD|nr:uncharacterized protein PADG_06037 [Paracoccidioides brasiliensis Pb18]EEH49958.2 hypothetical protein PADG_06037 [Paracoccidioides brasiliensis Pb18]ODH47742.1 hypothetical protein GX48_06164 [Paracoccidioides brasiliensis]